MIFGIGIKNEAGIPVEGTNFFPCFSCGLGPFRYAVLQLT